MGDAGKLVVAGALLSPVDGALFVFRGASRAEVEAFVAADPYVVNGLVTSHSIRDYGVVVGG